MSTGVYQCCACGDVGDYDSPCDCNYVEEKVADIEQCQRDCERAHGMEDDLYEWVLRKVAGGHPNSALLAKLALKTKDLDFARYTA